MQFSSQPPAIFSQLDKKPINWIIGIISGLLEKKNIGDHRREENRELVTVITR
jgi:hypothetical protein